MDVKKTGAMTMLGASRTEAWADVAYHKKDSNVTIPSLDAVERAKAWVEMNEK